MKKNLLIITQKVDKTDPVLGFFHNWIIEFSKNLEKVNVICLEKGEYDLPQNVKVFSLGKENGVSKIKYVLNFYKYIWKLRGEYKSVFVHMNQEYVLLGRVFWRIFGKKVLMWRNHPSGNLLTKISVLFSDKVYCTSRDSFTNRFKKTEVMPVGINVPDEIENNFRVENTILSAGRISPVKNIEDIISAFSKIIKVKNNVRLSVVGSPTKRKIDEDYYNSIINLAKDLPKDLITFSGSVPPEELKNFFKRHDIFINGTTPGSFDKTILEAVSLGCVSFVCQDIWQGTEFSYLKNHFYFEYKNTEELSKKVLKFLSLEKDEKMKLRKEYFSFVFKYHSLQSLVEKVIKDI